MRSPLSVQSLLTAVFAVVGLLFLWSLLGNSKFSEYRIHRESQASDPLSQASQLSQQQPPPPQPPQLQQEHTSHKSTPINNPYREWFWVWQDQNHTHTVVIATMSHEDTSWLQELAPQIEQAIYVVDDEAAPLHPPANKGNEAMVYLSYIIDFYDRLPDVSTFMHNHASAWHISDLLNRSSISLVQRLSLEKVVREGYVNLRCDLDPGCPISAQLDRLDDEDNSSHMNGIVADTLANLGLQPTDLLATPCCAQFAISRETIRQRPVEYYISLRKWLLKTDYPASVSGRIFEYVWHYIFTSKPVVCPNELVCFCDAYSICFPTQEAYDQYTAILKGKEALTVELSQLPDDDTRRDEISKMIGGLQADADIRKEEAFTVGSSPVGRQKALHDAWELMKTRGQLHNF